MKRIVGMLLFGLAVGVIVVSTRRQPQDTATTLRGFTMGTSYTVRLAAAAVRTPRAEMAATDPGRARQVNDQMSTYRPDSEISRFNRSETDGWFAVSKETALVVSAALDVARQTGGAFDITVAPLVNLWSFGPDQRPIGIPSETEIAAARELVDYRLLQVRLDPPALRKQNPDLAIDLSGIAKGYAVDQVAELLDAGGLAGYMIEIGGEVRTKGSKLDGRTWRIGLEGPQADRREVHLVVAVQDCCLASSGDYRSFFEWDGRVYSHEIDPRTGWPVQDGLAAVSVIGPSVMMADALATGLMILPADEAWQLAQHAGLEVLFVVREADGFRNRMTPGFPIADAAAVR